MASPRLVGQRCLPACSALRVLSSGRLPVPGLVESVPDGGETPSLARRARAASLSWSRLDRESAHGPRPSRQLERLDHRPSRPAGAPATRGHSFQGSGRDDDQMPGVDRAARACAGRAGRAGQQPLDEAHDPAPVAGEGPIKDHRLRHPQGDAPSSVRCRRMNPFFGLSANARSERRGRDSSVPWPV